MRGQLTQKIHEKYDIKAIRSSIHYFILLGVSVYVLIDMEKRLSIFRAKMSSSMSERTYEQEQAYQQIVSQIKEYSGDGPDLENPEFELPTYRYEAYESNEE